MMRITPYKFSQVFVFLILFLYCLITSPFLLIAMAMSGGGCYYASLKQVNIHLTFHISAECISKQVINLFLYYTQSIKFDQSFKSLHRDNGNWFWAAEKWHWLSNTPPLQLRRFHYLWLLVQVIYIIKTNFLVSINFNTTKYHL